MDSKFDSFIGRKVAVNESVHSVDIAGENYDITECDLAANETVVAEITKVAGTKHVRVWLPGTMGTMDLRLDRLNVHIDKMTDGSYEVTGIRWG